MKKFMVALMSLTLATGCATYGGGYARRGNPREAGTITGVSAGLVALGAGSNPLTAAGAALGGAYWLKEYLEREDAAAAEVERRAGSATCGWQMQNDSTGKSFWSWNCTGSKVIRGDALRNVPTEIPPQGPMFPAASPPPVAAPTTPPPVAATTTPAQ